MKTIFLVVLAVVQYIASLAFSVLVILFSLLLISEIVSIAKDWIDELRKKAVVIEV